MVALKNRIVLALAAAALLAVPAESAGSGAWVVADDVVIEGRPLVVSTDILVAAGGALRLRGVDFTAAGHPGALLRVTVAAGGLLELADGASLLTGAQQPTSVGSPYRALQLVVETGGTLRSVNATLRDTALDVRGAADFIGGAVMLNAGPMLVEGAATLRDAGLQGTADPLVRVDGGAVLLEQTRLERMSGQAVQVRGGSLLARDVQVLGAQGYAFDVSNAEVVLERVAVLNATDYGLLAEHANVVLRANVWATECGAFLGDGTTGEVVGNKFEVDLRGLTLSGAGAVHVAGNAFEGGAEALRVRSAGPVALEGNTFHGAARAISLLGGDLRSRGDRFMGNEGAIEVLAGQPATVVVRGAAFEGQADFGLRNELAAPVDARESWWGSTEGPGAPGADRVDGLVEVAPWLASAP